MNVICLDFEGVLIPEIWIGVAEKTGIDDLKRTTRDEPDYHKLMKYRMDILRKKGLKLSDIQDVIATLDPLEGASDFLTRAHELGEVVILSDTFVEVAKPLLRKLGYPFMLCNSLSVDGDGYLMGIMMRQEDGKRKAVEAFKSINCRTFASGDSYNDLSMIDAADKGILFRPPENIVRERSDLKAVYQYDEFLSEIEEFVK